MCYINGMDHKHITIINGAVGIVSKYGKYGITYDYNWWHKLRPRLRLRLRPNTFTVQESITIVTYDRQNIFKTL